MSEGYQPVPQFYAEKSVFITGGAGYLGKVLIEKLLYSCPGVNKVYLLLRDKKNLTAEQRLKAMLNLPVFGRLKKERPRDLDKVVLMKGDICAPNLDLNPGDLETLIDNVSVVIHSAASIKFNDPLKLALKTNVEGTRNVLNLCHVMKRIQVFVHVSTAFSNADRPLIEEVVYPPPVSIDEVYKFVEQGDQDESKLAKLLDGRPNTYTFTKALAEQLVVDTHGDIPAVIIRPSIVTPSKEEPVPGWVDNWYGSTGLLTSIGMGICRVVYTSDDHILDIIPVDYVSNLTLVAAARGKRQSEIALYNSCSSSTNPIYMRKIMKLYNEACLKDEFNVLPNPSLIIRTKKYWLVKAVTFLMFFFAQMHDLLTRLTKSRPRLTNLVAQSVMIQKALEYFTSHSWVMMTDRTRDLIESLSPEDARMFPCQATDIKWEEYIPVYYEGVKKYLIEKNKA